MIKRCLFGFILGVAVLSGTILLSGGWFIGYFDFPSLALIVLMPFAIGFMSHGPSAMGASIKLALGKGGAAAELPELKKAKACIQSIGRYAITSGMVGFFLGFIAMFKNLADRDRIGPNLAVSLISSLYALLLLLFFTLPLAARLEGMIIERENS